MGSARAFLAALDFRWSWCLATRLASCCAAKLTLPSAWCARTSQRKRAVYDFLAAGLPDLICARPLT
jgi:hypothetical protein